VPHRVNLLRGRTRFTEVSLVAILDADKGRFFKKANRFPNKTVG